MPKSCTLQMAKLNDRLDDRTMQQYQHNRSRDFTSATEGCPKEFTQFVCQSKKFLVSFWAIIPT